MIFGGVLIRVFGILLDSHLNFFDEQFHALVAKHLMMHPLTPTLYEHPVLPYDKHMWIGNHIWLHKQPLFMWQMAFFIKIFGVNLVALRLHLVLMSGILMAVIYRMGSILVSKKIGFYATLFFIFSNFAFEQASGYYHTEHNDVTFLFYITLSIWSWLEFTKAKGRKKILFALLTGLFSGAAILVKWLVGLLVYSGWGIAILWDKNQRKSVNAYLYLALAFFVSVIVALPWQIYISYVFPEESAYEFGLNSSHFFEIVEGHSGTWTYYFEKSMLQFGVPFVVIIFALILLWKSVKNKVHRIGIIAIVVVVYTFYTVATTKMPAFTFIASPIIFIALAVLFDRFFKFLVINKKKYPSKVYKLVYHTVVLVLFSFYTFNPEEIQMTHTSWTKGPEDDWTINVDNAKFIKQLDSIVPNIEQTVLFNMGNYTYVWAMFHASPVAAYGKIPTQEDIEDLKLRGYKVAVYDDGKLPGFIRKNKDVVIFHK